MNPALADLMALSPEDFGEALARLMPSQLPSIAPPAMPSSPTITRIACALAKAQGAFPVIPRDRTVTVKMRDRTTGAPKGEYTFAYAPLSTIREKTRAALAENGLAIVQPIIAEPQADGSVVEVLRTVLLHESGEWLACDVPMFQGTGDNKAQAYNSGATYARRLGVTLLLCIAADEDDDGNGGEQDHTTPDYERQEQTVYRGSFPKSNPPPRGPQRRQQGAAQPAALEHGDKPRGPQARSADAQRADPLRVDYGSGREGGAPVDVAGPVSPWGEDLTQGELAIARKRATVAMLDDAGVLALIGGPITQANVSDALAKLKRAADQAIGG